MSFNYPLGLIGLIGVPIVIIIYIIKNKYTEQIVTSTYIWNLSEKFLKKKKQINLLSGLISLILQILAIILITLALAHPVFKIPNAAKEYCFILDASGSMNMKVDESTKFEIGKEKIENLINESTNGSKFTLISVGASTRVVYDKIDDREKAIDLLNNVVISGTSANYTSTLKYVQEYFDTTSSLETYLITDRDYESENIHIINISTGDDNFAINNVSYELDGLNTKIKGYVVSYASKCSLDVDVFVNNNFKETISVDVEKGVEEEFIYNLNEDFNNISFKIKNQDNLMLDNEVTLYNTVKEHRYNTLIVSDRPFYLQSIIKTLGSTTVEVIKREDYTLDKTGYSLYIFDSFSPYVLPTDGTVWLFGATSSIEGSGFSVQDIVQIEGYDEENAVIDSNGMLLNYANNFTNEFKEITKGLVNDKIYVAKYAKYGLYRNFNVLLTHNGSPVVFTGTTDSGNLEVVFAFDLHDSNLPLLMDYIILTKNLLKYSFPDIINKSNYVSGEEAVINVTNNIDSIRVESPLGNISYLSVSSSKTTLRLNEVGTYKLTIMMGDESKEFFIYVSLPEEESNTIFESATLDLVGTKTNTYSDGKYEKLIIFLIILTVIFVADWMVYCYEQHQLR